MTPTVRPTPDPYPRQACTCGARRTHHEGGNGQCYHCRPCHGFKLAVAS